MGAILACLCCCCYEEQQKTAQPAQRQRQPPKKKRATKVVRPRRLKTKYQKDDFVLVSDEDRHENRVKAYCCPICTLYYTRILACSDCVNFICLNCFEGYENKMKSNKQKMRCPFCSSQKSYYCDYELDPHSYFDTTNKGFLSKEERSKLQAEINSKKEEEVKVQEENQDYKQEGGYENHEEAVQEIQARE